MQETFCLTHQVVLWSKLTELTGSINRKEQLDEPLALLSAHHYDLLFKCSMTVLQEQLQVGTTDN